MILCELNSIEEKGDGVFEVGYRENSASSWKNLMKIDLARIGALSVI